MIASPLRADDLPSGCFDFNTRVIRPLRAPIPLLEGSDNTQLGSLPGDIDWGAARGIVNAPVTVTYRKLLDHTVWKDPKNNELRVEKLDRPGYLDFHRVTDTINPIPFIHVSWTEDWAYALVSGTKDNVREMVISYQKQSGTSHLAHLCGSVLLQPHGDHMTDVFLYEEAKASHRDAKDIVSSHLGTLRTLREVTAAPGS
jgi:hypothetical protein